MKKISVVLLIVSAVAIRFLRLDLQSLWLDEALSLDHIRSVSLAELYRKLITENVHPPVYYLFLRWWSSLFGETEFALRSLSATFSVGTLGVVGCIGARFFGRRVALTALVLCGTSLYQIWFAQEVKGYALSMLLASGAAFFLLENERKPSIRGNLLLAFSELLLIFTHYMNGLFLGAHGLYSAIILIKDRTQRGMVRSGIMALAATLVLAAGWFWMNNDSIARNRETLWFGVPSLIEYVELFARFLTYDVPWSPTSRPLSLLALPLTMIIAGFWWIGSHGEENPKLSPATIFILFWLLVPTALSWGFAQIGVRGFYFRTLALSAPALGLLLAFAICRIRPQFLQAVALLLVIHCSVALYPHYFSVHHKENWRACAAAVEAHFKPAEPIVFPQIGATVPFNYYFRRKYEPIPWNNFREHPAGQSIWLIHALTDIELKQIAVDLSGLGYSLVERHDFPGIRLRKYSKQAHALNAQTAQ